MSDSQLVEVDTEEEQERAGRAMRVAQALSSKQTDEFAKPGRLVEVRFVKGQSLSLTASRLLALMILTAGGDAWRDVPHRMRKADIRRGHKGNERISDMLEELHRTLFAEDDRSWRGRKATRRFSLIQMSKEEVTAISNSGQYTRVPMTRVFPVYLTYFTMARDIDGVMRTFGDIYGRDKAVLASFTAPRQLKTTQRVSDEAIVKLDNPL